MHRHSAAVRAFAQGIALIAILLVTVDGARGQVADHPQARLVTLDPKADQYVRVLGGPPATVTMRSGYVVLAPGKSVGEHSTESYEEAVIVLEGDGEMVIAGGPTLCLTAWSVAYCPPGTKHNVTNTGKSTLRYLYVVCAAPRPKE